MEENSKLFKTLFENLNKTTAGHLKEPENINPEMKNLFKIFIKKKR